MKKLLLMLCSLATFPAYAITYQYTDTSNQVVAIIDDDGLSRSSVIASTLPQGTVIQAAAIPPVTIPTSVTMAQARIALSRAGLLDIVERAIADMLGQAGIEARIYWATSRVVERQHSLVLAIGAGIGLSSAQLDALFITAAAIQ